MKDAIGGSLLLNLVVIFTSIIILFFVGIIAYSKAYKIKNRIIEVIERNETYDSNVEMELNDDLRKAGYRTATQNQVEAKCGIDNKNTSEYFYCVYLNDESSIEGYTYEVVTYIHFNFPVIGDMLTFAVKGETKVLGKVYDY